MCLQLLSVILLASFVIADDYCSLNCTDLHGNKIIHTVCERRPPCSPAPACGAKPRPLHADSEVRAWFLKRHNQHRNRVARGGVRFKGRTLKAANMRKLQWDEELEYTARCWVNACEEGRDFCRITERFNVNVGQNRFDRILGEDDEVNEREEIHRAVDSWYNEARYLNETLVQRYNAAVAPQAAQLLWARTTHIGCAGIEYFVEEERIRTTICNYGPGGNADGSAVWLMGEPCSKCGTKMCCDEEFDGMCAEKSGGNAVVFNSKLQGCVFVLIVMLVLK